MIESKYLEFHKIASLTRTEIWAVDSRASGFNLGLIKWFSKWRQYCFFPNSQTVFNVGCMKDISLQIEWLMGIRRKKGKGE